MNLDMRHEDILLGKAIKDITDGFHKTVNEDRKKWCNEHGKSCRDCEIECEAKEVS